MKIQLRHLELNCRTKVERVEFSPQVTFIHGPVSTGKSTVARLIDFCLGGELETTPALRAEFLAVRLAAVIGDYSVTFERELHQSSVVRVTWQKDNQDLGSLLAPLQAGEDPILPDGIFNLSDLIFHLAGVQPIKVRKSKRDPDSPLVRLSFRDLMWYCYLKQDDLDSSFFRMEDPFRRNKSIDAMRFVLGFHSDRLNKLDAELVSAQDRLRSNRLAAAQIREFLRKFQLGSDIGIDEQYREIEGELTLARSKRRKTEMNHASNTHVVDPLRRTLRELAGRLAREEEALADLAERIAPNRHCGRTLSVQRSSQVALMLQRPLCPGCSSRDAQRAAQLCMPKDLMMRHNATCAANHRTPRREKKRWTSRFFATT